MPLLIIDDLAMRKLAHTAAVALGVLPEATRDVLVSDPVCRARRYDLISEVLDNGGPAAAVPAIALTALVQKDDAQRAWRLGVQRHVPNLWIHTGSRP